MAVFSQSALKSIHLRTLQDDFPICAPSQATGPCRQPPYALTATRTEAMSLDVKLLHVSGPTYAPSRTLHWLRCPRLSQYAREWEPPGEWTPNLLVGQAIHAGIAHFLSDGMGDALLGISRAQDFLEQGWPGEQPGIEGASDLMLKGLKKALRQDLLGGGWIVSVEGCLDHDAIRDGLDAPHSGVPGVCAIADMIHETVHGELSITDHKTKMVLDTKWVAKQLRDTETSWQLFDYARRATLKYGRWVGEIRQHLVICSPIPKSAIETVAITPERLIHWTRSAEVVWARMRADERMAADGGGHLAYPMNWTSCWDFTRNDDEAPPGCPMFDGCHRLLGDTTKFPAFYRRREHN